jgi:glycosyltransferase involved in cell wall biosynthesis
MVQRPSIIYVAWSTSPTLGSEPGATWGILRLLLQDADVDLLVRDLPDSDEIERWAADHPESGLRVHRVPPTKILGRLQRTRFWPYPKISSFVLYRRWLHPVRREAERIIAERAHTDRPVQLVWHCGLTAFWLGTTVHDLGVPSVLGPVYGGSTTPRRLVKVLPFSGRVEDLVDRLAVRLTSMLPAIRRSLREADVVIVGNEETARDVERLTDRRPKVFNGVLTVPPLPPADGTEVRDDTVLWLGALEHRKGPHLVLRAMPHTPAHVRLRMMGSGPLRDELVALAVELGVADRVEFVPFPKDRAEVVRAVRTCRLAVFTGLREEGGLALSDGLLGGAAVAVLDNAGAGLIGRYATHPESVALIAPGSVEETARRLAAVMADPPPTPPGPNLDVERFGQEIRDLLAATLAPR